MPDDLATDQADLHALQQGEVTALNRLMVRWHRPLHHFAYRYVQNAADAQDLVAEAFVSLYRHRARLSRDTKLSAWLFTTLTNLCHNHHRWLRRHPTVSMEAPIGGGAESQGSNWEFPSDGPRPDAALIHDETTTTVRAAIARLPHDLKVTLILHHYEDLSYREISEIIGCSERGVETRLYRARRQLRKRLAGLTSETARP